MGLDIIPVSWTPWKPTINILNSPRKFGANAPYFSCFRIVWHKNYRSWSCGWSTTTLSLTEENGLRTLMSDDILSPQKNYSLINLWIHIRSKDF